MNPLRINIVLLINRLALGLFFFMAGYQRVFDIGVETFFQTKFKGDAEQAGIPQFIATPYGYALPFLEIIAGVALVLGFFGRTAAILIAVMLGTFLAANFLATSDLSSAAGPFDKNIVFLTLAIMLVITGPGTLSIDRFLPARKKKVAAPKIETK